MSIYAATFPAFTLHVVGTPLFEIFAGPTAGIKVLEIGFSRLDTGANQANFGVGIGRPGMIGTPFAAYVYSFLLEDNATDPAAQAYCATYWITSPTVPAVYIRQFNYGNMTYGAGYIWTFARAGLHILPSNSVVVWTMNAVSAQGSAPMLWVVIDE